MSFLNRTVSGITKSLVRPIQTRVVYQSDFSGGVDDWTGAIRTVNDTVTDPLTSQGIVLRIQPTNETGIHQISRGGVLTLGKSHRFSFYVYWPVSATTLELVQVLDNTTPIAPDIVYPNGIGGWALHSYILPSAAPSSSQRIRFGSLANSAGDYIYLKDMWAEEL